MALQCQPRLEHVGARLYVVRRGDGAFVVLRPRLPLDLGAERDDPLVVRQRRLEPARCPRGRSTTARASRRPSACLLGGDDVLLQPVRRRLPARGPPGPGPPLDLEPRLPERIRRRAELVQSRQSHAGLAEGEHPGPVLRGGVRRPPDRAAERDWRNWSNSGRRRSAATAARSAGWVALGLVARQHQHGGGVDRLAHQVGEDRERRAARGPGLVPLQAGPHPLGLDLRGVAAERGARVDPGAHGREPRVEIGDQRVVLRRPLLEEEGREEGGVHVGAELVERHVQRRLRFRVARLLQLAPPGDVAAVVEPLLDVERGLPAVLGEVGERRRRGCRRSAG